MVYLCYTCNQSFYDEDDLKEHLDDYYGHEAAHEYAMYGCDTCLAIFTSDAARWQHMNAKGHVGHECRVCDNQYRSEQGLIEHEVEDHNYCADCDKSFQNTNNIKQHLNSRTHRGQNIDCPYCRNLFTTVAGLTTHLETNSCRSAPSLNRDTIFEIVRQRDPRGFICKNLISWHGGESKPDRWTCTDSAWNGFAWACGLCSRVCRTRADLNKHLNSPAHYAVLYHRPNRNCPSEFKTLASIISHLESESCSFMPFDRVQKRMQQVFTSSHMLEF
ncbi:hypothetical protein GE21DRAFT_9830 [Neurospora crassa]|uniref:C2H2-type domain-containing protein n=1 Tax=Neurospora crassa (strain ATCC 24698 / 74-OR23-1A / CBS 708.71 / DSM 1257 / FGSC 987) TaxID=367110 RepID=Q7S3D3_NEUCR|nr:hypothetical protein NCU06920 [Neurospora crassa OR74A]EAA30031.1 hypothetical protein NCU06920 [Neurospora crassa OR74A]KHE88045.1 hypothetical protein GE21DRAFT_9830 [Neurospora crassa]|eukprot:XP_959267.1 hypothetical protein NCU06920 [Neurospora crassa OR74A]